MTEAPYPQPPWNMHGRGVFAAFRVPVNELALPDGMSPVTLKGQALGLVAYIEYLEPSPLTYRELIFMPSVVRVIAKDGTRKTGYWVSRMYVDSEASMQGGRRLWALPKTLARFSPADGYVNIEADDGTKMALSFRAHGPKLPLETSTTTIQEDEGDWVRFRGEFSARVRMARMKVEHFTSTDPGWRGFDARRKLPIPAAYFDSFDASMQPAKRFEAKAR